MGMDDWICPGCATSNAARKPVCYECQTPAPGTAPARRVATEVGRIGPPERSTTARHGELERMFPGPAPFPCGEPGCTRTYSDRHSK